MKIQINQLNEQLKKSIAPVYLITGDELLFVEEACQLIRKTLREHDFSERKSWHVDSSFDWHDLLVESDSLSLFAQNTLLELRLNSCKINDSGKKILQSYLDNPPNNKVLVIICDKLEGATKNAKWVKTIEKIGVIAQAWPISLQQLPYWIQDRLKQYDMVAENAAIRLIVEHTEGNLLATHQEIQKLALLFTGKRLTAEDVLSTVSDSSRYDIFTLVDAALLGDCKKTLHILCSLKAEASEPILILWSLTKEIRNLIKMAKQLEKNQSMESVLQQYYVWEQKKPIIRNALNRHSVLSLIKLLQKASNIDRLIKGVRTGNVWDDLEDLSLNLARCSKN